MNIKYLEMMLKAFSLFLIFLTPSVVIAQDERWDPETLAKAKTAKNITYLTDVEKDVIFYSNLVRLDSELFEKTYLQIYLKNNEIGQNKWVRALKITLRKTDPMNVLTPKKDLYEAAKKHATDMGKTGKVGHKTSKGKSFDYRMRDLYNLYDLVYENCNYGLPDGLSIVCDFLIDTDVPDAGHRKTILNAKLKYIGTSVEYHKEYFINCVQDFGS